MWKLLLLPIFAIFLLNTTIGIIVDENLLIVPRVDPPTTQPVEVQRFQEYLRIKSAHPTPDYESCITFFRRQADEIGLEFNLVRFKPPQLFAIWLTWPGSNATMKSILLNSHIDVVPAEEGKWIYPPYSATIDPSNGRIYGRGAVDMKSTTMAELEAIRRLKAQGFEPLRTIHVSMLPDEELGGMNGMKPFTESEEFSKLNIGFDLDEGGPVAYGQKSAWQFNFTIPGVKGHGASLVRNGTAGQKLQIVIDRLMKFRQGQIDMLGTPGTTGSNITSLNLMRIGGGTANNVLPELLWAVFDMRIRVRSPDWDFEDVERMLNDTAAAAGADVSYTFLQKSMDPEETPTDDSNLWWRVIKKICTILNIQCKPIFLSPTSDAKYVRKQGIPAFGFTPAVHVPGGGGRGVHGDNEFITIPSFLAKIDAYQVTIKTLSCAKDD